MAQRRSKRKQPSREKHLIKEQLKIDSGVFEERTMKRLSTLFSHGIISELGFMLARGKEADVYAALPGEHVHEDVVIVKIFRLETSNFMRRVDYIYGDPRFGKVKKNIFALVNEWCKKEYGNLKIAVGAEVHAPLPYYFDGNVLAMQFIGTGVVPSQNLKVGGTKDPEKTLDLIIEDMKKLYGIGGLVHADVSEYNILMKEEIPYLIDFGQAVVLGHPKAMEFLERDVSNILAFFAKEYGIRKDPAKVLSHIIG